MGNYKHRFLLPAVVTAAMAALSLLTAGALIRNIGNILLAAGEIQFAVVFSQIRTAQLVFPLYICVPVFAAYGILLFFFCPAGAHGKIALWAVSGVLLFLIVTALTLWLTRVNGVCISDIVISLLGYLKNGLADVM